MTNYWWKDQLESSHRIIIGSNWKIWFQYKTQICSQLFKNTSPALWETLQESPQSTFSSWAAHLGNNSGTPSDNLPWQGDPALTQPLPAHLRSLFFTDAPWWEAISGYFSNDFHPASWAQFRQYSLENLAGWTNQRQLASLIWIRLDCSLALGWHTPLPSPVDFILPPLLLP